MSFYIIFLHSHAVLYPVFFITAYCSFFLRKGIYFMDINEYQHYHEAKQHVAADFPYNTYLCSIPLDFTHVMLHWHDEMEIIVIKKGQGIVCVDFDRRTVRAGDIIFIRPGQLHSIEQDALYRMEYENILFLPRLLAGREPDLCVSDFIRPLVNGSIKTAAFLTPELSFYTEVNQCIEAIDRVCSQKKKGWPLAVKAALFQLFYLLLLHRPSEPELPPIQEKSLEKLKIILKYIEEHYAEHLTVEDMAALCYYSKSHFMKFFKTHMGTGFIDYLNSYRLSLAERLLRTTGSPVLEIAADCGFENLSYFNRLFKRTYRLSPGAYRKLQTNRQTSEIF